MLFCSKMGCCFPFSSFGNAPGHAFRNGARSVRCQKTPILTVASGVQQRTSCNTFLVFHLWHRLLGLIRREAGIFCGVQWCPELQGKWGFSCFQFWNGHTSSTSGSSKNGQNLFFRPRDCRPTPILIWCFWLIRLDFAEKRVLKIDRFLQKPLKT